MSPEKRRSMARQQKLGWRLLVVAAAGWILGVLMQPMGSATAVNFATSGTRFTMSYVLATISIVAALVALAIFKPWRRKGSRNIAILLVLLTLILGDIYILSWNWRLH